MYICEVPEEVIAVKYELVGNEKISSVPGRTGTPVLLVDTTVALVFATVALAPTPRNINDEPELKIRY
jgi:hypothetical protein